MKRKSILLTCIVAIMALVMFVGCDNAPTLPSFVVGGTINQTGDFLEGQAFDPSKFNVTITYDNGRIVAADETVSVYLDTDRNKDGKVNFGDTVKADLGKNFADSDICATAAVKVYTIKSLAVTGPQSYAYEEGNRDIIPESDLTVTATYLDSANAEKTMILTPGEYQVGKISENAKVTPSAPSLETSVEVTALVGNFGEEQVKEDFGFTLTYGEPVTEFESIASVELKESKTIAALDYETLPAPTFDDVTIMVNTTNSTKEAQLVVEPEDIRLFYVDANTGLEVNETSFVDGALLSTGVEYNGVMTIQSDATKLVSVKTATVELKETKDYDFSGFVRGEALPEIDAEHIVATLKIDNVYQEIEDTENIVYKYFSAQNSGEITDGKVPAAGGVLIGAEYLGAKSGTKITVSESEITDEASTEYVWSGLFFDTADTYVAPAKQYYDDINTVIDALSVDDLVFDTITDGDKTITVDPADVEVYYSTTNIRPAGEDLLNVTLLTDENYTDANGNKALVNDNVYIVAEYPVFDAETNKTTIYVASVNVSLSDPVVTNTELVLSYADTEEDETPLIGKGVNFTVVTSNDAGIVASVNDNATNKKRYTLIIDGTEKNNWTAVTVTDKDQIVVFYDETTGVSLDPVTIVAGRDFIAKDATIAAKLVSDKVLIAGTVINDNDYIEPFTAEDFEATATTGADDSAVVKDLEIVGVEIPVSLKATGSSYDVPVRVRYTDSTRTTKTPVVYAEVPVVNDYPVAFTATPIEGAEIYSVQPLTVYYFDYAVTRWASNPAVEVKPVPISEAGIAMTEMRVDAIAGAAGEAQNITITWTPEAEAIKDRTVEITGTITPIADYPKAIKAGVSGDNNVTVGVNSTFGAEAFNFQVTWTSGLKYGEGGTTTATVPTINYTYTCAELGAENAESLSVHGASTYTVLVSWACNGHESAEPIPVTLHVNG